MNGIAVDEICLSRLDIESDGFQQDPYPWYAEMRRTSPVCRVAGLDWYFVATMELLSDVLADFTTYSSRVDKRREPPSEAWEEVRRLRASRPQVVAPLLGNDPPTHAAYRRMANRAFTPRTLKWMENSVYAAARQLVADLPGEADFLETFAIPLPVYAISAILGLDASRRADVRRWTTAIAAPIGATLEVEDWLEAERQQADFDHVILSELEIRRRGPRDDLLSHLVRNVDREVAPRERAAVLLGLVRQLLVAGNETTTRLLPECIVLLAAHPETWERLRAGLPGYTEAVVEEALRLASPVQQMRRRTTVDVTLGGTRLAAGTRLLVSFASANRDERVFPQADTFDPARENRYRHLAFGHGIHTCLGAGLARMEARIALETLAAAGTTAIEVLPHQPRYLPSYLLRGRTELPVRVTR